MKQKDIDALNSLVEMGLIDVSIEPANGKEESEKQSFLDRHPRFPLWFSLGTLLFVIAKDILCHML